MKDKSTFISYLIIVFLAGIFIGYTLTVIYAKDVFRKEYTVKVTPMGISAFYNSDSIRYGRILRQEFKVVFKNGVQVSDSWEGYAY